MSGRRSEDSTGHGMIEHERLYLGDHDEKLAVFTTGLGQVAAATIGDRQKNGRSEDSAAIIPIDDDHLVLIVADGVGGISGARRASNLAVEAIRERVKQRETTGGRLRTAILDGIEAANRKVLELGTGSATTLALAEVGPGYVRTYHVGDSIVLVCGQRGRLKLMTTPHSPVGFAMEAGLLDETEALQHADLNLIFNVVGSADMRIEVGSELPLAPYDTLLLASDGLTDNALQDEIIHLIRSGSLETGLRSLTDLVQGRMARDDQGEPSKPDDYTVILFRRQAPGCRGRC